MNIQEREEMDYRAGAATDMQNALAWSMMNRKGDDPAIAEALAAGRFVVVAEGVEYCPLTDAIMGSRALLHSTHATRADAESAVHGAMGPDPDYEIRVYILPRKPIAPAPVRATDPADDDVLPF